jgi:Flp pilus assembly protein CpaB
VRRSSRLILLLGIFLAVGAFVLIVFLNGSRGPASTPTPAVAHIVTAVVDIPQGTTITQSMVTVKEVALADAPGDSFSLPERVIGKAARQTVVAGSYVPQSAITGVSGTVDIAGELKPGERAIALQFDDPNRAVGFLVQAGNSVDVIVTLQHLPIGFTFDLDSGKKITPDVPVPNGNPAPQGGAGGTGFQLIPGTAIDASTAKLLIQNARVVFAQAQPAAQPTAAATASPGTVEAVVPGGPVLVVLAVNAQQAEVIEYVQSLVAGTAVQGAPGLTALISLAIRSPQDAQASPDNTSGVVLRTLLDAYGVLPPRLVVVPNQGR